MWLERLARVALISAALVHVASYVPLGSDLRVAAAVLLPQLVLMIPLHLSAIGVPVAAIVSAHRRGLNVLEALSHIRSREVLALVLCVGYGFVNFWVTALRLEFALELAPHVKTALELRLFSGHWVFFLGIGWLLLRELKDFGTVGLGRDGDPVA